MLIQAWFMLAFFGADPAVDGTVQRYERRYTSEEACLLDIERVLEKTPPHDRERAALCLKGFYINGK